MSSRFYLKLIVSLCFFTQINLRNVLYLLKLNFAKFDYTYIHIYFHNVSHFVNYIVHFKKRNTRLDEAEIKFIYILSTTCLTCPQVAISITTSMSCIS